VQSSAPLSSPSALISLYSVNLIEKGEVNVSAHKSGTQYAREVCQTFREVAETLKFENVKEKLSTVANELEPLVTKLHFKTQKGTEDMEELSSKFEEIKAKLLECNDASDAESMCSPFIDKLEKIIKHVKTMKVRMT
jgi:hypothetical protein